MLFVPVFLNCGFPVTAPAEDELPDFFVGVDVAYEDLTETKKLIDETSSYMNFNFLA
ncbi:hypothetical protein MUO79_11430 [Candidatus Bathyarchaeota archaeon]|nr:hypothetical protein [Candidatus Bathyarchaeota archaeon]